MHDVALAIEDKLLQESQKNIDLTYENYRI